MPAGEARVWRNVHSPRRRRALEHVHEPTRELLAHHTPVPVDRDGDAEASRGAGERRQHRRLVDPTRIRAPEGTHGAIAARDVVGPTAEDRVPAHGDGRAETGVVHDRERARRRREHTVGAASWACSGRTRGPRHDRRGSCPRSRARRPTPGPRQRGCALPPREGRSEGPEGSDGRGEFRGAVLGQAGRGQHEGKEG
jgi:hypothetical protein